MIITLVFWFVLGNKFQIKEAEKDTLVNTNACTNTHQMMWMVGVPPVQNPSYPDVWVLSTCGAGQAVLVQ